MFSVLTKIVKSVAGYPKIILLVSLILVGLSIYPVMNLRWELQLQDTLDVNKSSSLSFKEIEKNFGALGSLTIVLTSKDSLLNYNAASDLYKNFQNDSLIHFIEYETDIDFYKKNSLLYIENEDLDTIIQRIDRLKEKIILSNNPFYVDIQDDNPASKVEQKLEYDSLVSFNLDDLEKKYLDILSTSHANSTGTIRVIDIYPKTSLSDLQANRNLLSKVKKFFNSNELYSNIEIHYTGKIYDSIQTGRALLPEAKFAGKMTALFILLLFIIHFYKQPQLIVVSVLPVGIPILLTLALASVIYGRINLFTLLLALLLPGQACQIISHVLNRYFVERTKNLNPKLCIESAMLGIGSSTAVSALIFSALFACLILVPVAGLKELGILGSIGSILNWAISLTLTSSLLDLFQKKKPFKINSFKFQKEYKFTLFSYKTNILIIVIASFISLIALIYGGLNLKFLYDFSSTEIQRKNNTADSLIKETGFPHYDPIIIMMPSNQDYSSLYDNFKNLKSRNQISTIDRIYTLDAFSPKNQLTKKEKLKEIKNKLTKDFLENLDSIQLKNISKITQIIYKNDFEDDNQPENIKKKFSDINGNLGTFAFAFSNINPNDGNACRRLSRDLHRLDGFEDGTYKMAGTSVLRAKILDLVLSNIDKTIFLGSILVWFILLIFYNRFSRAIFTLLPSAFAMSWLLALINIFDIQLSVYSSIAFPILIGTSVDGSLQLWTAFYDKQQGTALTILQKKCFSVGISQIATFIGAYGLLISSHPGLRSIGQISLIGLICIFISQYFIFSIIAGSLDNYRIIQKQKKLK